MTREGTALATADLAGRLEESRTLLTKAIEGMDEEAFRRRAGEGEWNAAEVLAHLLSHEQRMLFLVRKALTEDTPAVQSRGEQAHDDGAKAAQRMPVPQIWHGLLAQRRETLLTLKPLATTQLTRTVQHSRMGEMSVCALVQKLIDYETEHAKQIGSIRRTLAGASS